MTYEEVVKEAQKIVAKGDAGDTVFIVESNRFIREAEIRSCSGGMYLVKRGV